MTEETISRTGRIAWADLTVPDADSLRAFYSAVIGWEPEPVDMGGYSDYNMTDPVSGEAQAGVCHRRGENAAMPPQWILYFTVEDLDASIAKVIELGGEVIDGPRGGFCIIRDPAGAVCAVYAG